MEEEKKRAVEASIKMVVSKDPGSDICQVYVDGNSGNALLYGLMKLIRKCAELMDMPVDKLYAVLATVIFTPALEVREDD